MKDMLIWTFIRECSIPEDVSDLLIKGEEAIAAYATIRDKAVQGITGKKIEMYSIPYTNINMWSTENAGVIDFNAEVELWTRAGRFKIKLAKGVDVRKFDKLIASCVMSK